MNENIQINYEKINGIFFFADLIDSLECGNYLTAEKYNELLCLYQNHFWRIVSNLDVYAQLSDMRSAEINVSGDGVSFFFPGPENIGSLIELAIDLKTTWLLSDFNINRIEDGKIPIDISVGLNMGPVMRGPRSGWSENDGWIDNFKIGMEGFPISIAKRFETFGREGSFSRIIVGQPVLDYCLEKAFPDQFHSHGLIKIKGLSQGIPAYELKTCWNSPLAFIHIDNYDKFFNKVMKIVRTNPKNSWYYLWISDLLSDHRKYAEADNYIKLALKYDSNNAQAYSLLSEASLWNEDYGSAKSYLQKSINIGGIGFYEYAKSSIAHDGSNRFRGLDIIS
jgi:class 3 adenylate cyclase